MRLAQVVLIIPMAVLILYALNHVVGPSSPRYIDFNSLIPPNYLDVVQNIEGRIKSVLGPTAIIDPTPAPDKPEDAEVAPTPYPTFTPTAPPPPAETRTPAPTPTPTALPPIEPPTYGVLRSTLKVVFIEFDSTTVVQKVRKEWHGSRTVLVKGVARVQVGFDLGRVRPIIDIHDRKITITLPRATVISAETLFGECEVWADNKWLPPRPDGVEMEALEEALNAIKADAQENESIRNTAEMWARRQLEDLLLSAPYGYEHVEILFDGD